MSNAFDRKKIIPRYKIIAYILLLLGFAVIVRASYVATAERDYWMQVASRLTLDSMEVKPARGNILSCDGQLLAGSLPKYILFVDFDAMYNAGNDTLWTDSTVTAICEALYDIRPVVTAAEMKAHLQEGFEKRKKYWRIWNGRVNYDIYTQVKELPILSNSPNKGGLCFEEMNARERPFGSLAKRTVGELFAGKDSAKCGLELTYDSVLRGQPGIVQRRKVMNKYLSLTEMSPVDGADIVTTIDVDIQDLAERALIDELKFVNGNVGVAIVMEVKTGEIKAMVNMTKGSDGEYYEMKNNAVSDLLEPGSVFKTASIIVALDDGVCDTTEMVDTGEGVFDMHGSTMRDHNWRKKGYGYISLPRTLEVSSNIGVSRIIDKYYGSQPEKFVEGIYRLGLADSLGLPLMGSSSARIRMPQKNSHGTYTNWSNTALPWMSIGYETQVPPISTLTFYNAIANDGKMMRPCLVKQIVKDGEVVQEFAPEVMRSQIAKPQTVKTMQTILEHVVSQGLGRRAGSKSFKVAGKTGTAQISKGAAGYKSGQVNYLLSFCGFFPADKPRYSCIVCIQKTGLPASGGGMCGPVFREIAEGIMSQDLKLSVNDARDAESVMLPDVKSGNMLAADYVLSHIGVNVDKWWDSSFADGNPIWGNAVHSGDCVRIVSVDETGGDTVPDVTGMGARDAVAMLERRGVKVRLDGRGRVVEQSLPPGNTVRKGDVCTLRLDL